MELSVRDSYILLGYYWYPGATTIPPVRGAHSSMTQACMAALMASGVAALVVQAKLHGILREMGMAVDPLAHVEKGREYNGIP